jgi:ABC-2 type transport system permease protein
MKRFEWIIAILKVNWSNMVTNAKAFYVLMGLMLLQNLIYFSLWVIMFHKISSLRGWQLSDVAFLFASGAFGYGIFFTLFGGLNKLGHTIQNGELDIYLARPRSTLAMALLQSMRADSLGDVVTGIVMLVLFVKPPIETWPLLLVLSISAGMVFAAFRLISHTLAFWGLSGEASENSFSAFLITGTNPQKGFTPLLKLALLTIFPAGYIGLLPVEIMRHFRWDFLCLQLLGSSLIFVFSLWLFEQGLKRYTSGNKFLSLR